MSKPPNCSTCDHCCMEPDCNPYCGAGAVVKVHPFGQYTSKTRSELGLCGPEGRLWERRQARPR